MSDSADRASWDDASRFLAAVLDAFDEAVIGKDLQGRIVSWNRGAERLYGYAAAEVVGRSLLVIFPDDRAGELEQMLARVRRGERVEGHETVRRAKDGRLVDVALRISPVFDSAGTIVGAATIARDLTSQRKSERALHATEARWRSVAESAVDGIIVIDAAGRIESINPAVERLFGYTEAEVVGQNVRILMPSPYREEHDGYLARYHQSGVRKIIGIGREVTGQRRDGTTFPLHLSVGEMVTDGERKFTGILHDLTDRVRMEEQLREQTALARIGEMAAVLAHEVKNPLAGVRGAVEVIGRRLPSGSRDAGVVTEILARLDGLNGLMTDLLLFARPPKPHPVATDIASLVTTTAELLTRDPNLANVQVAVSGDAPPLMVDPELLKIVFVNLLVNGAQAMDGRGRIDVKVKPSHGVCHITVLDTGPGVPEAIRDKIFKPFFTTKSRGSGLGLPTVKRIVEAHDGRITLTCPPGGGTAVAIQLPQ